MTERDPNRSHATGNVYHQLATRLRKMVHDEHRNGLSGAERFSVIHVTPALMIEHVGSDVVLEEGDPDFTIGAWLRQYRANYTLEVGDAIWCVREGMVWHAIDVVDPGGQVAFVEASGG